MPIIPMRRTCALVCLLSAAAAAPAPAPQEAGQQPSFRQQVHLVVVPVVVRDAADKPVGGLTKDDFRVFDEGKLQAVAQFSAETHAALEARQTGPAQRPQSARVAEPAAAAAAVAPARAQRFVAYLFDDVHLDSGELMWARGGVERAIAGMEPADRAAIFTTSGRTWLGFTDDRDKLREALLALKVNRLAPRGGKCVPMNHLMGKRLWEHRDTIGKEGLNTAALEALYCLMLTPREIDQARRYVEDAAREAIAAGEHQARAASMALKQVVRLMGSRPGQRTVVLLSPGFLTQAEQPHLDEAVNLAARLNVVISSLDARGLAVALADDDAGTTIHTERYHFLKQEMDRQAVLENRTVLARVAEGTGGRFIENTNDLDSGLRQISRPPEHLYVLAFSPKNLVPDGRFHRLRIELARKGRYTLQARRGYFATKDLTDPAEAARREIEDAVFAPEDINDPAVDVHTEFMKSGAAAQLSVLTRFDLTRVALEKSGDRNANDLTVVSCVFDQNGNFVTGKQQLVQLRLRDETLDARLGSGLTVKTEFDVQPGTYAVRIAVRDLDGRLLSAKSSVVEIP